MDSFNDCGQWTDILYLNLSKAFIFVPHETLTKAIIPWNLKHFFELDMFLSLRVP